MAPTDSPPRPLPCRFKWDGHVCKHETGHANSIPHVCICGVTR
jgi:hypothetical protein